MNAIKLSAFVLMIAAFGLSASACGGKDDKADAGVVDDLGGELPDGGDAAVAPDVGDVFPDAEVDAGTDVGVTFSDFVHDLIRNHTNELDSPVLLPEPPLPDNAGPADYNDLF